MKPTAEDLIYYGWLYDASIDKTMALLQSFGFSVAKIQVLETWLQYDVAA